MLMKLPNGNRLHVSNVTQGDFRSIKIIVLLMLLMKYARPMTFRLNDLVIAGALYHRRPSCVHGRILLRGCNTPCLLELTGAPAEDVRGRSFEFEVPENDRPATHEDRERVARFKNQQVGPCGEMTAARQVMTFDGSTEEFCRRSNLGEPPPMRLRRSLYLEWFSQNGRVVIELPRNVMVSGFDLCSVVSHAE